MTENETVLRIKEHLQIDGALYGHGFLGNSRDFNADVRVVVPAGPNSKCLKTEAYRFTFTHCVLASISSRLSDKDLSLSWDDLYLSKTAWKAAGEPDGHVWSDYADTSPGGLYVDDSPLAEEWTNRLGRTMHEVVLDTTATSIRLIFHDLKVDLVL